MMEIRSELEQGTGAEISVVKPDIHIIEADDTYGKFTVDPLERGLGITLGNAMRRVLLNSIESAAITWVKIDGIQHEYSTIPHVAEDVTEFLLNVKAIRIRGGGDQLGRLVLDVKGEGEVCAGDISPSAEYQVANPELHLATLDSEEAKLSVEFNVERGRGYVPARNANGLPIGALPVDAIFTPVRKVNYSVEAVGVGQAIDKERLVLDLWIDGTLSPLDAIREAGQSLVEFFFLFSNAGKVLEQGPDKKPLALAIPPEQYNFSIENLGLSARTLNCLKRDGLNKVGEVLERGRDDLLSIRNFGEKSLAELYEALEARGIAINPPEVAEAEGETEVEEPEGSISPEAVENPEPEGEETKEEEKAGIETES